MHIRNFSCGAKVELFGAAAAPPTEDATTTANTYYAISKKFKVFRTALGNTLHISATIVICAALDNRCAVSSDLYCDFF